MPVGTRTKHRLVVGVRLQITEEFNEFVSTNTAARAVGGKSDKSDMKSLTDTVRAMPQ